MIVVGFTVRIMVSQQKGLNSLYMCVCVCVCGNKLCLLRKNHRPINCNVFTHHQTYFYCQSMNFNLIHLLTISYSSLKWRNPSTMGCQEVQSCQVVWILPSNLLADPSEWSNGPQHFDFLSDETFELDDEQGS